MTTKTIYAKLVDARSMFHKHEIKKTGRNTYSNYDYFELADFLIPAMQILAANDLMAIVSFETELATMTVHDMKTGESFVITSPMSTANLKACQPVQSMGACQTFVRRYLYTSLFEIVEHDALEENTGKPEPKEKAKKPAAKLATKEQRAYLENTETQIPPRRFAWLEKGDNFKTMTEVQAKVIIDECKALETEK
jgi:hypothetical protein